MAVMTAGSEPRWMAIRERLRAELATREYGSQFHSISDVCDKFNVSRITAIRVLNELAQEGLIEKIPRKGNVVRRISPDVAPGPTRLAVRLVTPAFSRQNQIMLDPVARRLFEGVTAATRASGIDFNVISETHLQSLFPHRERNFAFLVLRELSIESLRFLARHDLPHVVVDPLERVPKVGHAVLDRYKAGYLATRHLLELGHRRIAWITGPIHHRNFRMRLRGGRDALREAGIRFDWQLIRQTEGASPPENQAAFESLWSLPARPTAILAGDDTRAIHTLDACRRMGIQVPGDLSVLSYPNNPEAALTDPPLTAIDGQYEKVGEAALKLLLEQLLNRASGKPAVAVISPELVIRSSTAAPKPHLGKRMRGPS